MGGSFLQMVFVGFMVCGVLAGYIADRYGRWKVGNCWFYLQRPLIFLFLCLLFCWVSMFHLGSVWRLCVECLFFSAHIVCSNIWLVYLPAQHGGLRRRRGVTGVSSHLASIQWKSCSLNDWITIVSLLFRFVLKTEFIPAKYRAYLLPLGTVSSSSISILFTSKMKQTEAMILFSCQIFWMTGSMLIILLGMLVVPTMGWRWMIRLSITPSIILIFLFKVQVLLHVFVAVAPVLS